MKLALYQVDAFASQPFEGNPAAVCPLRQWLPDEVMQSIAAENNLSETAFFVETGQGFQLRWFTPTTEVDLCGHATLASAHVLFHELGFTGDRISFESKSGMLTVSRHADLLQLDFPAQPAMPCETPAEIIQAFGITPVECLRSEDYLVVFDNEQDIETAQPDLGVLGKLDLRGVMITARSNAYDFVVRFFAPKYGIDEDPVTGSAYTQLTPYWSDVLGKDKLHARQLSGRGGEVFCQMSGERVLIAGKAVKYLAGEIDISL
jgi:PhzF family phenazine biosynthesis protein